MGADLSAELKEARDITGEFLKIFAIEYSKMYLVALMKAAKKTIAKEAAGPQWVLIKCAKAPPPPVLKTGTVKKLSKYLKNWNSRFMVAKGDHLIDYYETEDKYKAGAKPLGTINMSNKNLHRDANDTVLNRLIALAEKCNINIDEMPKPEKYPDFTLEIYHEQKGPIYLTCENEEEWKSWCDLLDRCRWQAPRLNLYEDKAHVFAFPKALWRTRWELCMWGWWSGGGGEQSQLVDAINDKIADVVLSKLDRKLTMPWGVRYKIRNKFISTVDGIVTTAVGPAWKAAYSAVESVRPTVEPKIKEGMAPIVEAQQSIQDEICKMVEASSKDFINEKILPHLAPLLDVVFSPVVDGFRLLLRAFDVALEKGKERYEPREDRLFMVWHHNYNSEFWDAERKMWDLYEPLWALRLVFDDIYPWSITGRARRRLRKTFDNALYTFETILEDGKASGLTWDQAADQTRRRLAKDCRTGILRVLGVILFGVVENFFEKLVIRPARKLVKPLSDKVPQAIKDFVDPDDMLEELLYAILRRTCAMVFEPYTSKIDLGVPGLEDDATVVTRSAAVDVAPSGQPQNGSGSTSKADEEAAAAAKAAEEAAAAAAAAAAAKAAEEEAAAAAAKAAEEEAAAAAAAAAAKAAEEEAAAAAAAAKATEAEAAAEVAAEQEAAAGAAAAIVAEEAAADAPAVAVDHTDDSSDSIELIYFNLKGRAHPTRLVLAIGGVPFKDTRLTPEQYGAMIGTGALPLDTLPILKVEGKVVSSQSLSMLRFAGELTDMQLSDPEDVLRGEDILATASDLAGLYGTWLMAPSAEQKTQYANEIVSSGFSFYMKHIEYVLASRTHDEPYIGQTISFVDVFLFSIVGFMGEVSASIGSELPISEFSRVQTLVTAVGNLPAVQAASH